MVHMHHSQPLKMKFGTNHFLGSETLVPLQYRVRVNRDRCCRFKLLCALKIMKNSKQAKSFYSLWDTKICKQNLFTPINCLDNAVCLHFSEIQKSHN